MHRAVDINKFPTLYLHICVVFWVVTQLFTLHVIVTPFNKIHFSQGQFVTFDDIEAFSSEERTLA